MGFSHCSLAYGGQSSDPTFLPLLLYCFYLALFSLMYLAVPSLPTYHTLSSTCPPLSDTIRLPSKLCQLLRETERKGSKSGTSSFVFLKHLVHTSLRVTTALMQSFGNVADSFCRLLNSSVSSVFHLKLYCQHLVWWLEHIDAQWASVESRSFSSLFSEKKKKKVELREESSV